MSLLTRIGLVILLVILVYAIFAAFFGSPIAAIVPNHAILGAGVVFIILMVGEMW